MSFLKNIKKRTLSRKLRVRNKLKRTSFLQFKAVVVKSNRHMYVSLVDMVKGVVLGGVSSLNIYGKNGSTKSCNNLSSSKQVGELFARLCKKFEVNRLVFDRGENLYHGKVASLAEGIREAGINF